MGFSSDKKLPPNPFLMNLALNSLGGGPGTRTLLGDVPLTAKRKAFFSFHFDDVWRVNNVRNAWKIDHPDSALNRSFFDSSLWESKKLEGPDAVKRLIREGVNYTSAVCVLIGSDTWSRQWVRYEIARAVVDQKGLLAVHINNLTHHQSRTTHALGRNPLDYMGIFTSRDGKFLLYEKRFVTTNALTMLGEWQWLPYQDYVQSVPLPRFLSPAQVGWVMPLSAGTKVYDYVTENGHKNIGAWIDQAAVAAGR